MFYKKGIAGFEVILVIVSLFAFSYMVAVTDDAFMQATEESEKLRAEKIVEISNMQPRQSTLAAIFNHLRKPMIPTVSAADDDDKDFDEWVKYLFDGELTITETRTNFDISSQAEDVGCCFVAKDGQVCATAAPENCVDDGPFAEGALCIHTSFCKKGCCYDETAGIYDRNTLEISCPTDWVDDPNCNMPAARRGCCVLDGITSFETLGQCEVRTFAFAQGDGIVDWRNDLDEGRCMMLASNQKEGACVIRGGECSFGTEANCYGYDGDFYADRLCSSPLVNSSCEPTGQTTCVDGKDGVYFLDSCGNIANIYDSERVGDPAYWDMILPEEEICGDSDTDTASANSSSCGNCNRFLGSICRSAAEYEFDVDSGDNYCKDTSCVFEGENYKNGESWCVYDGKIGNGDDVVGSRHWKYVCSQGTVQVEPCADYRNQICAQTNTFDVNETDVEFRNAGCVANNWRACINLNSLEGGLEECNDALNCRVKHLIIADEFTFDLCLPKYPGGFSLKDERYMKSAEQICGIADQTCTVMYKQTLTGSCEIIANKGCLKPRFGEELNDFCNGLGDCGGSVNILGEYTKNHKIVESPQLSALYIKALKNLANAVPGQFAEVEDYSEYLEASGLWGGPGAAPEEAGEQGYDTNTIAAGALGIVYAANIAAGLAAGVGIASSVAGANAAITMSAVPMGSFMGPFTTLTIAFSIGMIAGSMLAKLLGFEGMAATLMAVGVGALVAGIVAIAAPNIWNPIGWLLLAIAAILIIWSVLLAIFGDDCDPVDVVFECKPWKPPVGGGDCEVCNEDPLKPCSEYRCNSLGAACEILNKGTDTEMCHASEDDGKPPILRPRNRTKYEQWNYTNVTEDGYRITNPDGDCIDAYTPIVFGVTTEELSYCKFDMMPKEFENMEYDLGLNAYVYEHTTAFTLPDPSHGESRGLNWTGDFTLYIKCEDAFGHVTPNFYNVEMCVKQGPDIIGPIIRGTEPENGGIVGFNATEQGVTVVTNEFATCKWSLVDVDYFDMENDMTCSDSFEEPSNPQGYVCTDVLPITNSTNEYYIRCADQPWLTNDNERNANAESYLYTIIKPDTKISIEQIKPNEDMTVNTQMTTIELQVETSGGADYHLCSYSFSGYDRMIKFFETGVDRYHSQTLNRPAGQNKIYVECEDETGDFARNFTEFTIIRDVSTPAIARAWQTSGTLHVITTEDAECKYTTSSCRFNWDDGESAGKGYEHTIGSTKGDTYYIKCEDGFGNAPSGCSIILQAL